MRSLLFCAALSLFLFFPAQSATIHVPGDYDSIDQALWASHSGDTVLVAPGTYVEAISFPNWTVTLKSMEGPDVTIIDENAWPSHHYPVVKFVDISAPDVALDGFTLINGEGSPKYHSSYEVDWRGGGIFCSNASPLIQNCIICDNKVEVIMMGFGYGGGFFCEDGSPTIRNCRIENNDSDSFGGGVYCAPDSLLTLENTVIVNNTANSTGGVSVRYNAGVAMINCTVTSNDPGGVSILSSCSGNLLNTIVWGNDGSNLSGLGTITVDYSNIEGGWSGPGNIDADPLFVDAASGDVHLQQAPCQPGVINPCVDAADPSTFMFSGTTRTDGVQDSGVVDMGYHYPHDFLVPVEYPTIQLAINVASGGDRIRVSPGLYFENIDFLGKDLLLESTAGAEDTIIQGDRTGSVVTIADCPGNLTLLRGFTITNGLGAEGIDATGGGITCFNSSPRIEHNIIMNNEALFAGGGMYCKDSDPKVENNVFEGNEADHGGGLYCWNWALAPSVTAWIARNDFRSNKADRSGGGLESHECDPVITENLFVLNECLEMGGKGGGIACDDGNPVISKNEIMANEANLRGGGIFLSNANALLDRNRIHGNDCENSGGGVAVHDSAPVFINNMIYENSAYSYGGGLTTDGDSQTVLTNNTIYGNYSATFGGGLYGFQNTTLVTNCILWGNSAPTGSQLYGNGFDVTYSDIQGGCPGTGNIKLDPQMMDPEIGDFHITLSSPCLDQGNPYAPYLPNIDFEGDARTAYLAPDMGVDEYTLGGITLMVPDDYAKIQDALNQAVSADTIVVGPGTYLENIEINSKNVVIKSTHGPRATVIDGSPESGYKPVVHFRDNIDSTCVFEGFTVTNGDYGPHIGGGISCYNYASPTIRNNIICFNRSACGGGIGYHGFSSPEIMNNIIFSNTASDSYQGNGGGIYHGGTAGLENNVIFDNTASDFGGGVYATQFMTMKNCVIYGNTADAYGGGIWQGSGNVLNCTIFDNHAVQGGGGWFVNYAPNAYMVNSILWDNEGPQGKEICIYGSQYLPTVLYISHTDVDGGMASVFADSFTTLNIGDGMIDADPLIAHAESGDFHLLYGSPCRNAGDNNASLLPLFDIDGNARIVSGTTDMGADEFATHMYCIGDFTPGGSMEGKFVGEPATWPVALFIGSGVMDPPLQHMWGDFYLEAPWVLIPLLPIPSDGILVIPTTIPATPPGPYSIPMQALVGDELTGLYLLEVGT